MTEQTTNTETKSAVKKTASDASTKPATPKKTTPKKPTGPTVAVFIDIENTNASRENILEIFSALEQKGKIAYGKLYGYRFEKAADYDEVVAEHRLETVGRMRYKAGDDSVVDTRLVVDCILATQANKYDYVFVWAGVGDLMSLFAHIKQIGSKVVTVDLPAFDSTNKFVDQKIKLFSPHTMNKPVPVAKPAPVATYSAAAVASAPAPKPQVPTPKPAAVAVSPLESIMAGRTIPQLPRKKGAPEFGKTNVANSFDAIADNGDDDTEADVDDEFDDITDEELDELEALAAQDMEDFDDIAVDEEVPEETESDVDDLDKIFDEEENEKLLALTQQMLRSMKEGKEFDPKKAASEYEKSANKYDPNDSNEAPSDKIKPEKEGPDEFSDFGSL